MNDLKSIAQEIVQAALQAVDPFQLILKRCQVKEDVLWVNDQKWDLKTFERIWVLGAGKASAPMARALETLLGPRIAGGVVIVKYGHQQPTKIVKIVEAGHPLPDENTLKATQQLLQVARSATEKDLVIFLLSGGGSALLEYLPPEISLEDLQTVNRLLLGCGASIEEINTVRKHLSLIKGGQLAQEVFPATLLGLVLSDVIGDPLQSIASGPTAPDDTTFEDAWHIVRRYQLQNKLPQSVVKHLQRGLQNKINETPKANSPIFKKVHNIILGNNRLALQEAKQVAQKHGFNTLILTDRAQGEVAEISRLLAAIFEHALLFNEPLASPGCLLLGGEPTVKVKGQGLGGRNQELVLHLLKQLPPLTRPFYFCSIGTDGTDGPTDAAGAWIDHHTKQKVSQKKIDLDTYLQNNDSYHFFAQIEQLIKTGPTGTNVMDIMLFLF